MDRYYIRDKDLDLFDKILKQLCVCKFLCLPTSVWMRLPQIQVYLCKPEYMSNHVSTSAIDFNFNV